MDYFTRATDVIAEPWRKRWDGPFDAGYFRDRSSNTRTDLYELKKDHGYTEPIEL
jgi:hypothetical protein